MGNLLGEGWNTDATGSEKKNEKEVTSYLLQKNVQYMISKVKTYSKAPK